MLASLDIPTTTNLPPGRKTRLHSPSIFGISGVSNSSSVKLMNTASRLSAA